MNVPDLYSTLHSHTALINLTLLGLVLVVGLGSVSAQNPQPTRKATTMPRATSVPADDYEAFKSFEFSGETYRVKTKFKMFKFFRMLNENPVSAIELAVEEEDFARLEDLELDMDDFKTILEAVAEALGGDSAGNS